MKRDREAKDRYDETTMDQNNIIDAENTRNDVYAHLKSEIDQTKASIIIKNIVKIQ